MLKTTPPSHPEQQITRPMPSLRRPCTFSHQRIRQWQSIRWRLAVGSIVVALLATVLLAFAAIVAIIHYYSIAESTRLANFASESAQRIGLNYKSSNNNLADAATSTFPSHTFEQSYSSTTSISLSIQRLAPLKVPSLASIQLQPIITCGIRVVLPAFIMP